ncbi:MAG: tetratricopeptide repeat protein [Acidobacteria bacterium]|nr:MAG: tetratricopeptide repeat protein [Acidobacteriota bacterium]
MASSKRDQIIQEAEKLAARGKLDAAIKQYMRAVDQVPSDTNTLNRLGDLLVRVERIPEAIEVYQRIAEHFATDGFFLKSIAIYKKVNRLDPRRTETYERLADLYFKQGLAIEGRQQLLTLADWFLRSKQPKDAMRVFRRLIEHEPSNLQARAKLVDLAVQTGDVANVGPEIDALGRSLLSRGMLDEAVKLYFRILDLGPEQADLVAPCIDALVAAGRQAQGVELAKKALATGTGGIELRRAAARVLVDAGETDEAVVLLEDLFDKAPERTDVAQLLADVMIRTGITGDLKGRPLPLIDRLLQARDVARAATLVKKLMAGAPGDIGVLERALRVFGQLDDTGAVVGVETALADAYFVAGRRSEAVSLYRRLATQAPSDPVFARRLAELGETPSTVPASKDARPPAPGQGDDDLEFVEVDIGSAAAGPGPAPEAAAPRPQPPPAGGLTEPSLGPANLEELFTEAVVFAKYGLTDKAVAHLQRLLAMDPAHGRGRELLASLGGEPAQVEPQQPETPPPPTAPPAAAAGVPEGARAAFAAFSQPISLPPAPAPEDAAPANPDAALELAPPVPRLDLGELGAPAPASPPSPAANAGTPLPSFDALLEAPPIATLRAESARSGARSVRLDDLEALLGLRHPPAAAATAGVEVSAGPAGASAAAAPTPAAAPGDAEPVEVAEEVMELVEVASALAGPGADQLRELDFLIQQGLLDDAAKLLQKLHDVFADHPDVLARQAMLKARGWDEERRGTATATAAELFSEEEHFFDLAAELEKELADEEMVAEATGSGKGNDVSIEDLFKEFQRGVAEQVEEEDFDTHFNLGLAYREMGLLDEAIGEFQLSAKSPDYLMESASMIGACYIEKGLPEQGAEWYQRALTAPTLPAEAEVGLRYELGRAHELAGNTTAALACFGEVLAINPSFRDVVARISKLRSN